MINFNSAANTEPPIGHDLSCVPLVVGCIMETALNFEPGANTNDTSCIHPAESVIRFYVGSAGNEISWVFRSTSHDIEYALHAGELTGKEYASEFFGFGYEAVVLFPAGRWVFAASDAGGNGWPGSHLHVERADGTILLNTRFGSGSMRIDFEDSY